MIGRRHEQARLQSDFYRIQYRKILKLINLISLIILLLAIAIIYYLLNPAPASYYESLTIGQIVPMSPA